MVKNNNGGGGDNDTNYGNNRGRMKLARLTAVV
jgi:hypothetical protein